MRNYCKRELSTKTQDDRNPDRKRKRSACTKVGKPIRFKAVKVGSQQMPAQGYQTFPIIYSATRLKMQFNSGESGYVHSGGNVFNVMKNDVTNVA